MDLPKTLIPECNQSCLRRSPLLSSTRAMYKTRVNTCQEDVLEQTDGNILKFGLGPQWPNQTQELMS